MNSQPNDIPPGATMAQINGTPTRHYVKQFNRDSNDSDDEPNDDRFEPDPDRNYEH